jgi:undecaprenyl-diphosphatase
MSKPVDELPDGVPEQLVEAFPPQEIVRPAVSLLHRDPPITAKHFFYHRKLVFGATLTFAVGLALLASWHGGEILLHVDDPVANWVARRRTDEWIDVFGAFSHLGDNYVVFAVAGVLALWTLPKCRYLAATLVVGALVRPLLEFILKDLVGRPRPNIHPLGTFRGPSHPSGHPLAAASVWGQLPAVVALHFRSKVLWWASVVVGFTVVALVAIARVVKGAHYLTDVAASYAWAALYLAAVQGFFDRYHGERDCKHPQHEVQAAEPTAPPAS